MEKSIDFDQNVNIVDLSFVVYSMFSHAKFLH